MSVLNNCFFCALDGFHTCLFCCRQRNCSKGNQVFAKQVCIDTLNMISTEWSAYVKQANKHFQCVIDNIEHMPTDVGVKQCPQTLSLCFQILHYDDQRLYHSFLILTEPISGGIYFKTTMQALSCRAYFIYLQSADRRTLRMWKSGQGKSAGHGWTSLSSCVSLQKDAN